MSIIKATGRMAAFAVVIGATSVIGAGMASAEEQPTPVISLSGVTLPALPTIEVNVGSLDGGALPIGDLVPGVTLPDLGNGLPGLPALGDGLPALDGLPLLGDGLPLLGDGLPALDGLVPGVTLPDLGNGLPALDGLPLLGDGLPVLGDGLPVLGDGLPLLGDGLPVLDGLPLDPGTVLDAVPSVISLVRMVLNTAGLGWLLTQVPVVS